MTFPLKFESGIYPLCIVDVYMCNEDIPGYVLHTVCVLALYMEQCWDWFEFVLISTQLNCTVLRSLLQSIWMIVQILQMQV